MEDDSGSRRLPLEKREAFGHGMFIRFRLNTFAGEKLPSGTQDSTLYIPDRLNVDSLLRQHRNLAQWES